MFIKCTFSNEKLIHQDYENFKRISCHHAHKTKCFFITIHNTNTFITSHATQNTFISPKIFPIDPVQPETALTLTSDELCSVTYPSSLIFFQNEIKTWSLFVFNLWRLLSHTHLTLNHVVLCISCFDVEQYFFL